MKCVNMCPHACLTQDVKDSIDPSKHPNIPAWKLYHHSTCEMVRCVECGHTNYNNDPLRHNHCIDVNCPKAASS